LYSEPAVQKRERGEALDIKNKGNRALAHDMNIETVAEGVETTNQMAHIESLNCAYWQGFLCSKPVKSDEAQALIVV
jgi:EAL domain-containing protein (putative c-di-GMP-specific phosphodiesterase class I)